MGRVTKLPFVVSSNRSPLLLLARYKSVPTNSISVTIAFDGMLHPFCHSTDPLASLIPWRTPEPVFCHDADAAHRCVAFPAMEVTWPLTKLGSAWTVFWPDWPRVSTCEYPEVPPA